MEINRYLWAKKCGDTSGYKWLPLYIHLNDTRLMAELLWEHWLSESQRNAIITSLNPANDDLAKNLVSFLAATHDLGKATPAFQLQKSYQNTLDLDDIIVENLEKSGFTQLSKLRLANPRASRHELASESILYNEGFKEDITSILGAHHGKGTDSNKIVENQIIAYASNYYQYEDSNNEVHQKWAKEQKKIIDWALKISGLENVANVPGVLQPGQVLIAGLIIMADWISSNSNYFPLISINENQVENLDQRADIGFRKWLMTDTWNKKYHVNLNEDFYNRFGFYPNEYQSQLINTVHDTINPGILIFEAPTGIGKTEAALFALEQVAYKKGSAGMFFALPTQATSNGIFPRILDWLKNITYESEENSSIRLLHGKAYLNEDFKSLSTNISPDSFEDATVIVNGWFSGRKSAVLDDFVVGTIDQFLLVALKQKHLFLRHLGFSKKVVIIDEVHAYDTYMSRYLNEALTWMAAYGVPVIILSATLPAAKRNELLASYMKGKGISKRNIVYKDDIPIDTYPLISYNDGNIIKVETDFTLGANKKINVERMDDEDLLSFLENLYKIGGNIGIIVNTVKKAQKLTRIIEDKFGAESVFLIHSRFIDSQRIVKEKELLSMIGKKSNRPHQKFYVGTQVIEQSLDIDFDLLITDLAPIDLLIQRIGRLHRHDRDRPYEYKDPKVVVIGCSNELEFDKGSMAVYSPYILARSQYYLTNQICIPDDVSTLVQKVYADTDIDIDNRLSDIYQTYKNEHEMIIERQKQKADVFKIKDPKLKKSTGKSNTLIGWISDSNEVSNDERASAQVRDTKETIEVIALKEVEGGYSLYGAHDINPIDVSDKQVAKIVASNTIKLPQILTEHYNFDKTLDELETFNINNLIEFQSSPWLRGSLGIIFNENDVFELNGCKLIYNEKFGLSYERM